MEIDFHLIVPECNDELFTKWNDALAKELPIVLKSHFHFIRARLDRLPGTRFDAIVSPANSYGRMDGGFDDAISKLLSPPTDYFALTRFVQAELYKKWRGFAVPGSATALLLPENVIDAQKDTTGCKYLLLCPTMHWPQDLSWDRDIAYNSVWALLAEIERHNSNVKEDTERILQLQPAGHSRIRSLPSIRSVLMPGLGTGTGNIPYGQFASQFALAAKNFDEALRMSEKWSSLEWEDVQDTINKLESTWSVHSRNDRDGDGEGHSTSKESERLLGFCI